MPRECHSEILRMELSRYVESKNPLKLKRRRPVSYTHLYKLSCDFTEIDCIQIDVPRAVGKLTDISYDCSDDRIIAAYTLGIYAVDKCTGEVDELYRPVCDWIRCV